MRLALHGPLYSGKTTLSSQLVDAHGFTLVNYTDYLKELAARALTHIGIYTNVEAIKADKARFRSFLQDLGTLVGFDEGAFVEQCLFEQAATVWTSTQEAVLPRDIIFDNVRTQAQFDILKRYGFVLLRLYVPADLQRKRAMEKGVGSEELARVTAHGIESALPIQPGEIRIETTTDPAAIADWLCEMGRAA